MSKEIFYFGVFDCLRLKTKSDSLRFGDHGRKKQIFFLNLSSRFYPYLPPSPFSYKLNLYKKSISRDWRVWFSREDLTTVCTWPSVIRWSFCRSAVLGILVFRTPRHPNWILPLFWKKTFILDLYKTEDLKTKVHTPNTLVSWKERNPNIFGPWVWTIL